MQPDTSIMQDMLRRGGWSRLAEQLAEHSRDGQVLQGIDWTGHLDDQGAWAPRCSRTTIAGHRCKRGVFDGQAHRWDDYERPYLSAEDWERYTSGACSTHAYREGLKA